MHVIRLPFLPECRSSACSGLPPRWASPALIVTVTALKIAATVPAAAQHAVAQFYKDRTLTVVAGSSPGGGVDTYARLVARHLGKHVPGQPKVIVSNMPGAGSLVAARHAYNVAPRDGTHMAFVIPAIVMEPLLVPARRRELDPTRLVWIGNANKDAVVCVVRRDAPVKTFADVLTTEIVIGATGPGSTVLDYPLAAKALLGARYRIVSGYPGTREISLAVEKGELHGLCGVGWSSGKTMYGDVLGTTGFARVLVQEQAVGLPELDRAGVPLSIGFARTAEDRRALEVFYSQGIFTRPAVMPPGVPEDRVRAMRAAFMAAMADAELQAEASRMQIGAVPQSGEEVQGMVEAMFRAPPEILERIARAMERSK